MTSLSAALTVKDTAIRGRTRAYPDHRGGRIRIPEDAIEEYLARSRFAPQDQQAPSGPVRLKHLRLGRPS